MRANNCRAMEIFAGMVECVDANVGKVVDCLESWSKTLVRSTVQLISGHRG